MRRANKNVLSEFPLLFETSEQFQREIAGLARALNTPEWKTYKDLLLTMKGIMATDMLSRSFTTQDAIEKDVIQRTYYNINQILDFLANPVKWLQKPRGVGDFFKNTKLTRKGKGQP
ncbi:MAG: hypothetical protein SVY53_09320 [Chloroflexota bacterium]|nr:hypothetical protein [Chloroflexota bacterium]